MSDQTQQDSNSAAGGASVLTEMLGVGGMTHIDDWIDSPRCKDDGERYAKFVFWYFRYPAWAKMAFHEWMKSHKLFCTYDGERFRCTGASRMGDVWLARDFERETGYDLRVDVAKCEQWGPTHNAEFSGRPKAGPLE